MALDYPIELNLITEARHSSEAVILQILLSNYSKETLSLQIIFFDITYKNYTDLIFVFVNFYQ